MKIRCGHCNKILYAREQPVPGQPARLYFTVPYHTVDAGSGLDPSVLWSHCPRSEYPVRYGEIVDELASLQRAPLPHRNPTPWTASS